MLYGDETSELISTCESYAAWSPTIQPKCVRKSIVQLPRLREEILGFFSFTAINCTEPPPKVYNDPRGMYDWDQENVTFDHEVR